MLAEWEKGPMIMSARGRYLSKGLIGFSMGCAALSLLLLFPASTGDAQEPRNLKVLSSKQDLKFEHGFIVLAEPIESAEILKTVEGPASVTIAAYIDGANGIRYYLSDWSFDRLMKDRTPPNWIRHANAAKSNKNPASGASEATRPGRLLSQNEMDQLSRKSVALIKAKRDAENLPILKTLLGDAISRYGTEHIGPANYQFTIAALYSELGDWRNAQVYTDAVLDTYRKLFPWNHDVFRHALPLKGRVMFRLGEYEESLKAYQGALKVMENVNGGDSAEANAQRSNIADNLSKLRRYPEAVSFLETVYQYDLRKHGENDKSTLNSLRELMVAKQAATSGSSMTDQVLELSREIRENRAFDIETRATAAATEVIQSVRTGEISEALAVLEGILSGCRKKLGIDHPTTVTCVVNLGYLYRLKGDYAKAEEMWLEALDSRIRASGRKSPQAAVVLNHLGSLALARRDLPKAEKHLSEALDIRKSRLGDTHALTAESRNNLGVFYSGLELPDKAIPLLEKALKVFEANPSESARELIPTALQNLSACYLHLGEYERARVIGSKALAAFERHGDQAPPRKKAALFHHLGSVDHHFGELDSASSYLTQSLQIRRQLDPEGKTLELAATLSQLALVEIDRKQPGVALKHAVEILKVTDRAFQDLAVRGDADALLRFARFNNLFSLVASLGDAAATARASYDWKGRVLDALITRSLSIDSGGSADRRQSDHSADSLCDSLGEDTLFLDYIAYDHYLGNNRFESHYGVVVFDGGQKSPAWIDLGSAKEIDSAVETYADGVRGGNDESLIAAGRRLFEKLLIPASNGNNSFGLDRRRTVIVSTDARLNEISFATLITRENRFAGESSYFIYIDSARELAGSQTLSLEAGDFRSGTLLCVGDPDFGSASPDKARFLEALPGTHEEASGVFRLAREAGLAGTLLLGPEASESGFRRLCEDSTLIHLATHGFGQIGEEGDALGMRSAAGLDPIMSPQHPGLMGGIAFSGANISLQPSDAEESATKPPSDDGLLLPLEIRELDLKRVRLLTLSACDTGIGTVVRGEGVLGLRRAARLAGVDHLLISLWPIPDEETSLLMTQFYGDLFRFSDDPAAELFLDRQRAMLKELRKEKSLPIALRLAGGFIWIAGR